MHTRNMLESPGVLAVANKGAIGPTWARWEKNKDSHPGALRHAKHHFFDWMEKFAEVAMSFEDIGHWAGISHREVSDVYTRYFHEIFGISGCKRRALREAQEKSSTK